MDLYRVNTAVEAALDDLLRAVEIEPICGRKQLGEKRLAFLELIQSAHLPIVKGALVAAEASLTEMVRDGRAWDCDRRALMDIRACLEQLR